MKTYGARDIVRNPSLLRIKKDSYIGIEDKRERKILGLYIGNALADEFLNYIEKKRLMQSAKKIKNSSIEENLLLEDTIDDGL